MSRYRAHQILLGLVWSSLTGTQQASENFLLISLFALQSYGRGSNRIFQYISSLDQNKLVYIFRSLNVPVPMNIFLFLLEKENFLESRSICIIIIYKWGSLLWEINALLRSPLNCRNETFLEAQVRDGLFPPAVLFKLLGESHKYILEI